MNCIIGYFIAILLGRASVTIDKDKVPDDYLFETVHSTKETTKAFTIAMHAAASTLTPYLSMLDLQTFKHAVDLGGKCLVQLIMLFCLL
jgi:hypothetical protein